MVIRPAVVGVPRQNGRTAFHAGTGLREFRRELAKIIIERGAHDVVAIGTDEMNALTWESIFVAPKGGGNSPER